MTPGETAQPVSDEVPAESEARALCIVRNATTSQAMPPEATTLLLLAPTAAGEMTERVGRPFRYTTDSLELLLQTVTGGGDTVVVPFCEDQTPHDMGSYKEGVSHNVLAIYDRNREPSKRLMEPEPEPENGHPFSGTAASETQYWVGSSRGAAGESKCSPLDTMGATDDCRNNASSVGFVNRAMTCNPHRRLQSLYMAPEFSDAPYRRDFDGTELAAAKSIPSQLQKLFRLLRISSWPAIGTTLLTTNFGWDSSEAWQQQHVQELCPVMLYALEHKFKRTDQAKLIFQLCQVIRRAQLGAPSVARRASPSWEGPLVVETFGSGMSYNSVQEALQDFVTPVTMHGSNQCHCKWCGRRCDTHKGLPVATYMLATLTKCPYLELIMHHLYLVFFLSARILNVLFSSYILRGHFVGVCIIVPPAL
ncbi:hypothetical protein HPB48_017975 [Haemaphysalis longicornis]|uniref:Peptidase C19 ubiquitin carboxyl-terminal hydrolase domain-containing protein n=1 Tax=Haemaphysalis longicornis TaxID=44386 RepID=A0A9J6FHC5_HAELO|nr:hypothetical protein HPB48_017975 [Haemaphysalis longicornis]